MAVSASLSAISRRSCNALVRGGRSWHIHSLPILLFETNMTEFVSKCSCIKHTRLHLAKNNNVILQQSNSESERCNFKGTIGRIVEGLMAHNQYYWKHLIWSRNKALGVPMCRILALRFQAMEYRRHPKFADAIMTCYYCATRLQAVTRSTLCNGTDTGNGNRAGSTNLRLSAFVNSSRAVSLHDCQTIDHCACKQL